MAAPKAQGNVRSAIRREAAELFAANGVSAVSLFDVAQAAGISKGTLYYHYPTKESMVADVAEEHFMQMSVALFSWVENMHVQLTPEEGVLLLFTQLLADERLMRLRWALLGEALWRGGEVKERFAAKAREWAMVIEVGALKLQQPAEDVLQKRSMEVLPLLDACGIHMRLGEPITPEMLTARLLGK